MDAARGQVSATDGAGPWYRSVAHEREVFRAAAGARLPVLLKGPTGCGKTRFVEAMAHELGRELVTVVCNEETSAVDLLGRHLVVGGDTVWQDGPAVRAVRTGAMLYLDELVDARADVLTVVHPLADHRRELFVDRLREVVSAAPGFQLVASCNPGYSMAGKELKPSLRHRFVTVSFDWPDAAVEAEIVATEGGVEPKVAKRLVGFAAKVRALPELALPETVSTRLLVSAAQLIAGGLPPRLACRCAIVEPLADDSDVIGALGDAVDLAF